jgi:hypothetical protein
MSKLLKAQFNEMCISGLILDMNSVALYTGDRGLTGLEVTPNGIHIQPGVGNSFIVSTFDRKGPMYKESNIPGDYLPGISNFTARKTLDFSIINHIAGISSVGVAYSRLVGVL